MSEKKKVVFTSKTKNLNIVKKRGATIQRAVPGGTISERTPTTWIEFRGYKRVTSDPEEIEIIRQHIKDYPNDEIVEIVPVTPEDILKEKEETAAEAMRELEEAKGAVKKVFEVRKEEEKSKFKCSHCDFIGKNAKSLAGHQRMMHKDK